MRTTITLESTLTDHRQTAVPDPVLEQFLAFLADDMAQRPARVRVLDQRLTLRLRSLIEGVKVDLTSVLPPEQE